MDYKMKINLEIISSEYICGKQSIDELNTKELVPKMVTRRRLTRASKIVIYLANKVSFENGRIVYGSSFGELTATANILNSINDKTMISPTHFQNSVYNTAISYLSMLQTNKSEMMTVSSGDNTSLAIIKSGAIKALDGDTLLLIATETLDIPNISEVNNCIDFLECGVALKVKVTKEKSNIDFTSNLSNSDKIPASLVHMINIAKEVEPNRKNVIEVVI